MISTSFEKRDCEMHYSERELIHPAIEAIRHHGGIADTGKVIKTIKDNLPLCADDLEPLPSDDIPRIDRIIRNLKSHKTLLNMGLVEHYEGGFMLTDEGEAIETDELEIIIEKHFAEKTNDLTLPQAMIKYVDEIAKINFKNRGVAAKAIRDGMKFLPRYSNDDDRLEGVSDLVDDYVMMNPENIS